ncbi:SdrD B-like domain-containing protein [Methanolobus sp.]|uniref:SdrD B-like domain-containing protein n=1 Tax=Methanolobus sp. TaxID=1874737 RepID=UPI0025EBE08F|nr:SdrD B-like domain-containing protein [Methanolobus sp.]
MVKRIISDVFRHVPVRVLALAIVAFVAMSLPASACYIGDLVWNDLNGNGIQDAGEPGIKGVEVKLYKSTGGSSIATTTTNSNGYYKFAVNNNKDYKVKFILPSGYLFSPIDQGTDDKKDSDAGTNGLTSVIKIRNSKDNCTIDAGIYKPASVGNFVWEDKNNNGIQDVGEPAIEEVEVRLYKCDGEFVANTTTDSIGYYIFTGLAPGSYYMEFVKPTGSVFAPQGQGSTAIDSDADEFGKTDCFALISGQYYDDIDAGIYFPPEQEIPEFPTIALPVAAILGLAFIMQRKNE